MAEQLTWHKVAVGRWVNKRPLRWYIDWYDRGGRRHRLSYPDKDTAVRARAEMERQLNAWVRPPSVKAWPELLRGYENHIGGSTAKHCDRAGLVLERFWRVTGVTSSVELTTELCDLYFNQRKIGQPPAVAADGKEKPLRVPSDETRRGERRILHAFLQWCMDSKYLPANPLDHAAKIRPTYRKKKPARTPQIIAILNAIADPAVNLSDRQGWHLIVLLGWLTGLRQSVLLPAVVQDVEIGTQESNQLGLFRAYSGKTRKESVHGLPVEVSNRFTRRISDLPVGSSHLFIWRRWQRKAWERIVRHAGFPGLNFHRLRSACGTSAAFARLQAAGASALDHSSVDVFRRHYSDDEALTLAAAGQWENPPELPPLPPWAALDLRRRGRPVVRNEPSAPPSRKVAPCVRAASAPKSAG